MTTEITHQDYIAACKLVVAYHDQLNAKAEIDPETTKPTEPLTVADYNAAGYIKPEDNAMGLVHLEKVLGTNDDDENISLIYSQLTSELGWGLILPYGGIVRLGCNTLAELEMIKTFILGVDEPF